MSGKIALEGQPFPRVILIDLPSSLTKAHWMLPDFLTPDQHSATFKRQITAGLGYTASGLPYWTTDAGGFFRPGPGQYTDPAYRGDLLEVTTNCETAPRP